MQTFEQFHYGDNPVSMIEAFINARQEMPVITHDKEMEVGWNPNTRSKQMAGYATLEQILQQINPVLNKYKFALTTTEAVPDYDNVFAVATAVWIDGGRISSGIALPNPGLEKFVRNKGKDNEKEIEQVNSKDRYGANTSGVRYAIRNLFCLTIVGEDDHAARPTTHGNQASEPPTTPQRTPPPLNETPYQRLVTKVVPAFNALDPKIQYDAVKVMKLLPEYKEPNQASEADIAYLQKRYAELKNAAGA